MSANSPTMYELQPLKQQAATYNNQRPTSDKEQATSKNKE